MEQISLVGELNVTFAYNLTAFSFDSFSDKYLFNVCFNFYQIKKYNDWLI